MSLLVQDFLATHSLRELREQHGVYASFSKSGHKFSLNYDQLEAQESDPLAQECRGLILSSEDGSIYPHVEVDGKRNFDDVIPGKTKVLAYPMKRFFNYGQGAAANVNWSDPNLAVLEKLDGTLCIVYYDWFTNAWCVATRSVPEADLIMDNGIFTFRTLFEKALKDTSGKDFDTYTGLLNKNVTYCFELTTPYNRIVVNYTENRVTLLAARSMYGDFKEIDLQLLSTSKKWVAYDDLDKNIKDHLVSLGKTKENVGAALVDAPFNLIGVPIAHAYTYTSVSELIDLVSSLNPMEHEGVVVRDSNFNRVKVKNAAYVAYNRTREVLGTSERNCLELIFQEKDDDVIPFLPEEIVKNLLKIKDGLRKVIEYHDMTYTVVKGAADLTQAGDKKTFALLAQKVLKSSQENGKPLWQAPFFQMFDGKVQNMKDFIVQNKKDGTWSNSFLDKFLELIKNSY
jgi:hypothetical protein